MMRAIAWVSAVACLTLAGCQADRGPESPEEEAQALLDQNLTGTTIRGLGSCPSAVPGARTAVTDLPDGVAIEVTAVDGDQKKLIRERARQRVTARPTAEAVEHNGRGSGGGRMGHCPVIVVTGTQVEVEDIQEGARILVRARDPRLVTTLQQVTRERALALARGAGRVSGAKEAQRAR